MRFSLFALSAAFAVASALDLGDIPTCAISCFAVAVPASGCSLTDQTCQCTTGKDKITSSITSCVPGKCSDEDIAKIAPAVTKLCASAGITISNLPTAVSATGSSASNTASANKTANATGSSKVSSGASSATSGPAQSTGAAVANAVGFGAVALGLAAVFGI